MDDFTSSLPVSSLAGVNKLCSLARLSSDDLDPTCYVYKSDTKLPMYTYIGKHIVIHNLKEI